MVTGIWYSLDLTFYTISVNWNLGDICVIIVLCLTTFTDLKWYSSGQHYIQCCRPVEDRFRWSSSLAATVADGFGVATARPHS